MPKQRIWPILPGVRSFLNCTQRWCQPLRRAWGTIAYAVPSLVCPSLSRQPGWVSWLRRWMVQLTIARSGTKRSPRTSTNRAAMLCVICARLCRGELEAMQTDDVGLRCSQAVLDRSSHCAWPVLVNVEMRRAREQDAIPVLGKGGCEACDGRVVRVKQIFLL